MAESLQVGATPTMNVAESFLSIHMVATSSLCALSEMKQLSPQGDFFLSGIQFTVFLCDPSV